MELPFSMRNVVYTRERSRTSRRISIVVTRDAQLVVRAPARLSDRYIETLLSQKKEWIEKKIAYVRSLPQRVSLQDSLLYYRTHKSSVIALLETRVAEINAVYGFLYSCITVRRMKSRWGTCSRTGKLTFNFVITQLPEHLQTYIIVHELCHIKHFNHGKAFWAEVSRVVPLYAQCRKELRQYDLR